MNAVLQFCPYDMDFTIGMWHLPAWELQTTRTGFIGLILKTLP